MKLGIANACTVLSLTTEIFEALSWDARVAERASEIRAERSDSVPAGYAQISPMSFEDIQAIQRRYDIIARNARAGRGNDVDATRR